jgi:transposase-like protein
LPQDIIGIGCIRVSWGIRNLCKNSKTMLVNLTELLSEDRCYNTLRQLRWSEGVHCPNCGSSEYRHNGFHSKYTSRQRYICKGCHKQFDDLTGLSFEGSHKNIQTWMTVLFLVSVNCPGEKIAEALDLSPSEVHEMTTLLRDFYQKKAIL